MIILSILIWIVKMMMYIKEKVGNSCTITLVDFMDSSLLKIHNVVSTHSIIKLITNQTIALVTMNL